MPRNRPRRHAALSPPQAAAVDRSERGSQETTRAVAPAALSRATRWVLSLFAILHLVAVFAEPYRFSTAVENPGPAPHAVWLRRVVGPYVDAMYLSHGYFFFAPSPGPSHLIVAVQQSPAAQEHNSVVAAPQRIQWPSRVDQWPRLRYHRYFMLSEFYNTLFAPSEIPNAAEDATQLPRDLINRRAVYVALGDSIRRHLHSKYDRDYRLLRVEHLLPTPEDYFVDGLSLDDHRLYRELPESFEAELSAQPPAVYRGPWRP